MRNGLSSFRIFAQMRSWLRAMSHRSRLESDMESELQLHLEQLTNDLIRAGQLLKLELIDHVVIGNGNFSSLRSLGYFFQ